MTQLPADRARVGALIQRHDSPGPRYTSYPTAVEFQDGFTREDYEGHLARANERPAEPLSLYIHLPFCEERCLFCGCHVIITPHKERAKPYLEMLAQEVEMVAERLPDRRGFSQLHLGGGTPTYQSPAQLDAMLGHLFRFFRPQPGAELAIEVDPRVTTAEHIETLAARGFNRISLGVQDFTTEVQQAIHRVQSVAETRAVVEVARKHGYRGINIDLIYGLPNQTAKGFEDSIDRVLDLGPDRSAVYSFAHVPWIRGHQKMLETSELPPPELKAELFGIARERFLAAGYVPIGMDHFARPDDELAIARGENRLRRNFQGYAVIPASDVVGLGISAIGDIAGAYVQNEKKLSTYGRALRDGHLPVMRGFVLSDDDKLRRRVIHDLMCNFRVDVRAIEADFDLDFERTFAEDLVRLALCEQDGLVQVTRESIQATPDGELFVRNLARCFDRYWREKHEGSSEKTFSRTV